jgi:hypothetical protein
VKLAFARDRESRERLRFFIQFHFPESGSKVQGGKDFGIRSSNVTDIFGDFFHRVFVDVRVLVQFPEFLHNL